GTGFICDFVITSSILTDAQILQLATLPSILEYRKDLDITDDYEYLQESPFFRNNKNKIYELESIGFSPEFLKQNTNPKLILGDVCDLEADVELNEIEYKDGNKTKEALFTGKGQQL
ncbi:MAG: hypothetical protein WCH34_09340, partial [Bacteroidota bacterium]